MRFSTGFVKTKKTTAKDEVKNARLLEQAGFIYKTMAGVYAYLPLGLRVLEKIKQICREEMAAMDGNELIMTSLQRKELWESTDRWSNENVDVWFKSELKNGTEVGFAWSHEEPITEMMTTFIASYKDLPLNVYQFQTKFRNELRSKSGIMRGREFMMKDLYSYCPDEASLENYYNKMIDAYMRVFQRVGVGDSTYVTSASGGVFTDKLSHEFQTICDAGEDDIYIDEKNKLAVNEEIINNDEALAKVGVKREDLKKVKAAEVGNIFNFGAKKSEQLNLFYTDKDGNKKPVYLGSYGIGITRLMGVVVEKFASDTALRWPKAISPMDYHLVAIYGKEQEKVRSEADKVYEILSGSSKSVLYDDREHASAGEKLGDAELIGIPCRIIVSTKTLENNSFEYTDNGVTELIPLDKLQSIVQ